MKAILMSLMVVALVGGLVGGGLFAYFSDTETSTGNTFTAGTIDIELTGAGVDAPVGGTGAVWKPCETGYLNFVITNVGDNTLVLWKHIIIDNSYYDPAKTTLGFWENGINEPECAEYNGVWDPTLSGDARCTGTLTVNNLDGDDIWFDMQTSTDGTTWVTRITDETVLLSTVISKKIKLGTLPPYDSENPNANKLWVKQSFHIKDSVTNYAQTDQLVFDEEYYAEQIGGAGFAAGEEYTLPLP